MNTAIDAKLSAEHTQARRNNSSVQYMTEPNADSIDAVVEPKPATGTAQRNSLQIVQKSVLETSTHAKASPLHRLHFNFMELFAALSIPGQEYIDQQIQLQCGKAVDESDSLHSENIDELKAKERNIELQRIERYKMSGMWFSVVISQLRATHDFRL